MHIRPEAYFSKTAEDTSSDDNFLETVALGLGRPLTPEEKFTLSNNTLEAIPEDDIDIIERM